MSTRHLIVVFVLMLAFVSAYSQTKQPTHRFKCTHNVLWANPDSVPLTMDIYVPDGARANYPVVIIYHGGGWLINQKEIMDSLAVYLVSHAHYVVCNVNYRLLGDRDNTIAMNQIVEDALGAVVWVKANIAAYKGDGTRIAVTGDSAGGHLAAMVTLCGNKLEGDGFAGKTLGFTPTWLPKNVTAQDLMTKGGVQVQAAMLSYPAVDIYRSCQNGFETIGNPFWMLAKKKPRHLFADTITVGHHADYYKAVSPIYNIPSKNSRQLPPQFCMVGSLDVVTPPSTIKGYVEKCVEAGQPIEFWEYKGRPHAFLDSKKQPLIGVDFTRDGPEAIDQMIGFLNKVFYADASKK